MQPAPLILLVVFILIAIRQVGKVRLKIWQVMLGGAIAALLLGAISPLAALKAINLDVILFLFGMFVIGDALERSGLLAKFAHKAFDHCKSINVLILTVIFASGIASAFLLNDTLAIVGTPVVLMLAARNNLPAKALILALAFGVTIGSVMSPIGNPQNFLIAVQGQIANPFVTYLAYLLIPTILSLFAAYFVLRMAFYKEFDKHAIKAPKEPKLGDPRLAMLAGAALVAVLVLVVVKILIVFLMPGYDIPLTAIALIPAIPLLIASNRRIELFKGVDWGTLIFFAAMFTLMDAVWLSGVLQSLMDGVEVASLGGIFAVSIIGAQLISNVPLVALYIPLLQQAGAGTLHFMALAAASTVAGNLLILGAASNVIIVQNAERRGQTITFGEFARVGILLTILTTAIYLAWFWMLIRMGW